MDLRERLRNFLLDNDRDDIQISEIRFLSDGSVVFYVEIRNGNGKMPVRCKMSKSGHDYSLTSFSPMLRFNETHSPWDTTIKDTKNIFSAFPGIGGVANRTVNTGLVG
jgi:hypothetical protein